MVETLLQELITGAPRRNVFTPSELRLLLDLEESNVRKSARAGVLKRYEAALRRRTVQGKPGLRLSEFVSLERSRRATHKAHAAAGLSSK